jgi:hypothetical protein
METDGFNMSDKSPLESEHAHINVNSQFTNAKDNNVAIEDSDSKSRTENMSITNSDTDGDSSVDDRCFPFFIKFPKFRSKSNTAYKKKIWRDIKGEKLKFPVSKSSKYFGKTYQVYEYKEPFNNVIRIYDNSRKMLFTYNDKDVLKSYPLCSTENCKAKIFYGVFFCTNHMTEEG